MNAGSKQILELIQGCPRSWAPRHRVSGDCKGRTGANASV